jgi:hypothetical protein
MRDHFVKRYAGFDAGRSKPMDPAVLLSLALAIAGTATPTEYQVALADYYASGLALHRWDLDIAGETARIGAIPADGRVVRIRKGETVRSHLAGAYPRFETLGPLSRKLVLDYLASLNPAVQPSGWYRIHQEAIVEDSEHVVLPIGGGRFEVHLYRVETNAPVLLPPAAALDAAANPTALNLRATWIGDLSVLDGLSPADLDISRTQVRDLDPLRAIATLRRLRMSGLNVTNLDALAGMPLEILDVSDTKVTGLTPLRGMRLRELAAAGTPVADLEALAGMPLQRLDLDGAAVTNLSPLAGMPLVFLNIDRTDVRDLSALKGMPLEHLLCTPGRSFAGLGAVRAIPSLKTFGYADAADWRKQYDAKEHKADDRPGELGRDPGQRRFWLH